MAETLGTLASILQLVDTALKAREYMQDFRHAPQEQQKLLSEMDDLRPLLTELQTRITAASSSDTLQQMERPLIAFKGTMEQFIDKLRPAEKPLSKLAKQLKWTLWTKTEAKECLEKFEQFKSLLNSWLVLDVWDVSQQHRRDQDTAQRMQVIAWLSPINFFLRHADIAAARQPGTGGWLLENPRFKKWVSDSGGRLWCPGIPGAGETVLANRSMVVDHLGTQSGNANVGIACIYLNHKESDT
ncbi:hypothetical protein B0H17DRAFT_58006 [Mycena rosella]|uniref:Nephrocystin 3-like N-terminal domain-containing protein n=1 Tax=Mycena rosella TaxID=1033263 RepID=A0AAD7DA89_MYCRO|nr:hypothetical protein B0H17DRAFT_58006 [Mycena rosella]